jgi:hypothetical protein
MIKRCAWNCFGLLLLMGSGVWAQVEDSTPAPDIQIPTPDTTTPPDVTAGRMIPPPPVSGLAYPVMVASQERSNYLRTGLTFMTAYTDNALGSVGPVPLSDVNYSVAPFIAVDETTAREKLALTYAPGFTFYRRFDTLDQADHTFSIRFAYRLSPHVTFSTNDTFQKTSDVFTQSFTDDIGAPNIGPELSNFSVVAPLANQVSNAANVGLTYQFELNDMAGASGTFTNLHYASPNQVSGLFDSNSQAGLGFWAHRLSRRQYFGVLYQYQRLLAYPTPGFAETRTHAPLLFYTIYPKNGLTLSFFGGPQYSDTMQAPPHLPFKHWTPAGGASLIWFGHLTSAAVSYVHVISSSPGLEAAVKLYSGTASIHQQLTRTLSASISGAYAQNDIVGDLNAASLGLLTGHSIIGMASLQQQFVQHVALQLGYMRLRQDYSGVSILALTPTTNREVVSLTYRFDKALGR